MLGTGTIPFNDNSCWLLPPFDLLCIAAAPLAQYPDRPSTQPVGDDTRFPRFAGGNPAFGSAIHGEPVSLCRLPKGAVTRDAVRDETVDLIHLSRHALQERPWLRL